LNTIEENEIRNRVKNHIDHIVIDNEEEDPIEAPLLNKGLSDWMDDIDQNTPVSYKKKVGE